MISKKILMKNNFKIYIKFRKTMKKERKRRGTKMEENGKAFLMTNGFYGDGELYIYKYIIYVVGEIKNKNK